MLVSGDLVKVPQGNVLTALGEKSWKCHVMKDVGFGVVLKNRGEECIIYIQEGVWTAKSKTLQIVDGKEDVCKITKNQ